MSVQREALAAARATPNHPARGGGSASSVVRGPLPGRAIKHRKDPERYVKPTGMRLYFAGRDFNFGDATLIPTHTRLIPTGLRYSTVTLLARFRG